MQHRPRFWDMYRNHMREVKFQIEVGVSMACSSFNGRQ